MWRCTGRAARLEGVDDAHRGAASGTEEPIGRCGLVAIVADVEVVGLDVEQRACLGEISVRAPLANSP